MFRSARLKLTAWYLLIIMTITILFSISIYKVISVEIERSLRVQQYHAFRIQVREGLIPPFAQPQFDPQLLDSATYRFKLILILVDSSVFLISGFAGYFLAGKTLSPIQKMVDEQNRFVTDASHELNTPLTSLRTTIEVNLRSKQLTLKGAKDILQSNLEEVQNLQILSEDLIKLTQYQSLNGSGSLETVNILKIINNAVTKINPLALKKNIKINIKTSDYNINGENKSLTEVFVIFLDNAIKYSPENSEINIEAVKTDKKVKVSVSDNGVGIEKSDLPFIFNRFYRSDKSRSKVYANGYGLGLSIAKRIVTMHKGNINVASVVGKGTTFTIYLPVNQ